MEVSNPETDNMRVIAHLLFVDSLLRSPPNPYISFALCPEPPHLPQSDAPSAPANHRCMPNLKLLLSDVSSAHCMSCMSSSVWQPVPFPSCRPSTRPSPLLISRLPSDGNASSQPKGGPSPGIREGAASCRYLCPVPWMFQLVGFPLDSLLSCRWR